MRSRLSRSGTVAFGSVTDDHRYAYDGFGQLSSEWSQQEVDAGQYYRYIVYSNDQAGNRLYQCEVAYGATYYTANPDNSYSSITSLRPESGLTNDSDGNVTQDGTWYYTYDAENRISFMQRKDGTQQLQFAYDYLNRRVEKVVMNASWSVTGSTKFVWSGWQLAAELDAGTSTTGSSYSKGYVWGPDISGTGAGGLYAVAQGGHTYLPVYDPMGNITGYPDASSSGTVAAQYEYDAFGMLTHQAGSTTSFAFGYSTQYTDWESGLVYYGRRYYNPVHGRFVGRDPIEEQGGNNLFAFVANNPVNAWDTLGLCVWIETKETVEYGGTASNGWTKVTSFGFWEGCDNELFDHNGNPSETFNRQPTITNGSLQPPAGAQNPQKKDQKKTTPKTPCEQFVDKIMQDADQVKGYDLLDDDKKSLLASFLATDFIWPHSNEFLGGFHANPWAQLTGFDEPVKGRNAMTRTNISSQGVQSFQSLYVLGKQGSFVMDHVAGGAGLVLQGTPFARLYLGAEIALDFKQGVDSVRALAGSDIQAPHKPSESIAELADDAAGIVVGNKLSDYMEGNSDPSSSQMREQLISTLCK